jgi:hypothetical protein
MNLKRTLFLAVVALAGGCVSATQHFGSRAQKLEAWGDSILAKDARFASRVAAEYSVFLRGIPTHPSLDGIRARLLHKRAAAYRLMKREDLARKDEAAVQSLESASPYYREAPAARPEAEPGPGVAEGLEAAPGPESLESPAAQARPAPRLTLDIGAGIVQLTQRELRSDSLSHPPQTVDLRDDLETNLTTGIPELSLRLRGRKSNVSIGVDNWVGKFSGETILSEPLHYDGETYAAGESVRSRLLVSSTYLYFRMVPSAAMMGKIDFDIGVKHVYFDLRTSGSVSGTHVDAVHVPMLYPGLRVAHNIGAKMTVGGTLRAGGILWTSNSYSVLALGIETRLEARIRLTDRFEVQGGVHLEHMTFLEDKSENRRKEASLGVAGGFAEACFKF